MEKLNLKYIRINALNEIKDAKDLAVLNAVFHKYLGRKGEINKIFKALRDVKAKREIGEEINLIKAEIRENLEKRKKEFTKKPKNTAEQKIDITIPGKKIRIGHLHPLTQVKRETCQIFQNMGFEIADGPDIESEWYNFDALNVPIDHPAREVHDTFFVKQKNREKLPNTKKLIMRTHTSPVQVRFMQKNNPPLRIIVPGRCFRHEATDSSHEFQFYHLEGLMVGKDISVANFKAVMQEFLKKFFRKTVPIRLRPEYFPFTEPSFEVDMGCTICDGQGCSVCSQTGWLEMMGAGMVHPNVFKNAGLNPKNWQGFAFGMGLDRLTMMKYKIPDVRLFNTSDLRFLNQF